MMSLKQKAVDILSKPKDDVDVWAMGLSMDMRQINDIMARRLSVLVQFMWYSAVGLIDLNIEIIPICRQENG